MKRRARAAPATPKRCWWCSIRKRFPTTAPEDILGKPQPHAGHAPGQRRRHPVSLGDLHLQRCAAQSRRCVEGGLSEGAGGKGPGHDHHRDRAAVRSISPRTIISNISPRIRAAIAGSAAPACRARSASASAPDCTFAAAARLSAAQKPFVNHNRCKTRLSRFEGWSGAGCARVSIADHCRHDRACAVGLHAHGRAGGGAAPQPTSTPSLTAGPTRRPRSPSRIPRRRHQRAAHDVCGLTARRLRACARHLCGARRACVRRGLSSRCRRQAARRGLRPGRPHQHLRDRCRRLDHHAADRLGAGARPHAAGLAAEITAKLRSGYIRDPSVAVEIRPIGRSSSSVRSRRPANTLRAQHDRRERGRDRRRLLAARQARPRHTHPYRCLRPARSWCRSAPRSAPAIPCSSASAGSEHPSSGAMHRRLVHC